jgi:hypothetical protein
MTAADDGHDERERGNVEVSCNRCGAVVGVLHATALRDLLSAQGNGSNEKTTG